MDSPNLSFEESSAERPVLSGMRIFLLGVLVLGAIAASLWVGLYLTGGLHNPADWVVEGVTLGMTPDEAQASFRDASFGQWIPKTGCDGLAYEWKRDSNETPTKTPVKWARMEFHQGLLVAYRVKLDHRTRSHIEVIAAAVREERPTADGETVTMLSRACPTHQAEAEQLALPRS